MALGTGRYQSLLAVLCLLVVTAVLYYPALQFEFLSYDDDDYVLQDPAVQQLSFANLKTIFFEPYNGVWYPIARLSAAIDTALFEQQAWGHHLVSVTIHFMNGALLLWVLALLAKRSAGIHDTPVFMPALLISLLYIVHPQHVEVTAWVVQRKELLATLFSLLSLALFLKDRYVLATITVTVAMLSKPTAILMPFMFILLSLLLLSPKQWSAVSVGAATRNQLLPAIIAVGVAIIVMTNVDGDGYTWLTDAFSPYARVALYASNTLAGISQFVTLQASPIHQPIPEYVLDGSMLGAVSIIVLVVLTGACSVLAFSQAVSPRLIAFGFLFYCAALIPTGGIILFGNYAFGDRYLYLSSVGLYIALFVLVLELLRRYPSVVSKRAVVTALILSTATGFVLSQKALPKWATTVSLFESNIAEHPESVFINFKLGYHYLGQNDHDRAIKYFTASIDSPSESFRIKPRVMSALYMTEILCNQGKYGSVEGMLNLLHHLSKDDSYLDGLMYSLRYLKYDECYSIARRWRESQPRTLDE